MRPWKRLLVFQRVVLGPGESRVVRIDVSAEQMSFQDDSSAAGVWRVVNGRYQIRVGDSSVTDTLTADVRVEYTEDAHEPSAVTARTLKTDDSSTPTLVDHPIVSSAAATYLDGCDWKATNVGGPLQGLRVNATVPGDILSDLQRAGHIPDPYWNVSWRDPSLIAAWNNGSWSFTKHFATPAGPSGQEVLLSFDGVYMGATIELNGQRLSATIDPVVGNTSGATDQFYRYIFKVGAVLLPAGGKSNELVVTFGQAENRSPGTSGGRFTFSNAIE